MTESEEQRRLKAAMLSVYYASIGDQFDVSGAPSAFVPPEIAPQPLADALAVLKTSDTRLEQAIWQIVRNAPIRQTGETKSKYPTAIDPYLSPEDQQILDERRSDYRKGASLVAALLRACHHGDKDLFNALRKAVAAEEIAANKGYVAVVRLLYDKDPDEFEKYLGEVARPARWSTQRNEIDLLEREVGFGIATYVERLAATAAYDSYLDGRSDSAAEAHHALGIYPVHSVIKQSTSQLWTSATVTTLAHGDLEGLILASLPDRWHDGSDVIDTSHYVADPFSKDRIDLPDTGNFKALLYEVAAMSWGQDTSQQAVFRNVLNVCRKVDRGANLNHRAVNVEFSLCRSVSSDLLWDHRKGGITLDSGFLRIAPLGGNYWRVTSSKLLRFSDRTPYSGRNGWTDFGQMLNYLAPAALSWWVDTEAYSLGSRSKSPATTHP